MASAASLVLLLLACQRVGSDAGREETPPSAEPSSAPQAAPRPTATARAVEPSPLALEHVAFTLGGAEDEPLPWIVALHGLGDTPENFSALLRGAPLRVHVYAPRAPHPYGNGYDWFQAHVSGDPARLTHGVEAALERLLIWIEQMERSEATLGKPVLVGFSQGGILSFATMSRAPEKVALAVPIGGMLPKDLWPQAAAPSAGRLIALHGSVDPAIPLKPTQALVAQFSQRGYEAQLEAFPGVGHRIPAPLQHRLFEVLSEALPR